MSNLQFPTLLHQQVAETCVEFFRPQPYVDTILVTNSCARGIAIPQSDLDMNIMLIPDTPPDVEATLEEDWRAFRIQHPIFGQFEQMGLFTKLHLDIDIPYFYPEIWDDGGGPDDFEVAIGNLVAYSAPFGKMGGYFQELQARWLPYYDETLRQPRLFMVRNACLYDLSFVPFYVGRGLYFQAFDRLYKAFREFLQGLFIARHTYPIAYNKWIRAQLVELLGFPDLYAQLPTILSVSNLESPELSEKSAHLERLVAEWLV